MTFETKEEVLEKILAEERPACPHCGQIMNLWEVPIVAVEDGLGWGTPYLYMCFNDECPLYKSGWENMRENYGRNSSYRCMCYPGTTQLECIPVFSSQGARGQIIDEEVMAQQKQLNEKVERGISVLADCCAANDAATILKLLLDATEPNSVRLKAAEMIGDIGNLEAVEPIRNQKFGNHLITKQAEQSIQRIHERHFTRECPFCAEIIKLRAKICKHCGMDLTND